MSKSIEKLKLEERFKICYLRNRGNVGKVQQELDLPASVIYRMADKLKKRQLRDHKQLIADNLTSEILFGRQTRIEHLFKSIDDLEENSFRYVSDCCGRETYIVTEGDVQKKVCFKCNKECKERKKINVEAIQMKKEILQQLQEEDKILVAFADKMGYTKNADNETNTVVHNHRQQVLVINDKGSQKLIEDASSLAPMDRERLIKRLELSIIEDCSIQAEEGKESESK